MNINDEYAEEAFKAMVPVGRSYHYKVRAFHGNSDGDVTTEYSGPQYIDLA